MINLSEAQMYWNHAASFAGSNNSYIKCRYYPTLNLTGSFTIEAWINPGTLSGFSKGLISKGGAFGTSLIYGMRLESSGRVMLATNGAMRLRTKVSTTVPVNTWTHIAATYNSSSGLFSIYYNGSLDTSAVVVGASPVSNTDTLYFGISGSTTPFSGKMDEIRIWNRALPSLEVRNNMRTSISAFGGFYNGLVLSLTFQTQYANVTQFNVNDWSANFNTAINNGVSDVDLSDVPSQTICINQAVTFGALDDYIAGADNAYISPTNAVTLQAWIYPKSNSDAVIIHKGTPNGATTNYSLNILNKKLSAKINGTVYNSTDTIKLNQWSHVAFIYSYTGITRTYRFYVNGKYINGSLGTGGAYIADGSDSLYIGGTIGQADFNGLIDEVRISRYAKSPSDLNDSLFIPMNFDIATNYTSVAYNFDGYSRGSTPLGPNLFFRNNALMIAIFSPLSPLDKAYSANYQKGFYMKFSGKRIPESGGTGVNTDTLDIYLDENISDINVYAALDHQNSSDLEIELIGPDGSTVQLFNNNQLLQYNESVVTIFDDGSPTSMANSSFTSFAPKIKPVNNINSVFSGKNTKGLWKLKINDQLGSDTGRLNVWGIQFNNKTSLPLVLSCKSFIQGFYIPVSNSMVRDTMYCNLRIYSSPYAVVASAKAFLQSDGSCSFSFTNTSLTSSYYIHLTHRNSIETWSSNLVSFTNFNSQLSYDFTTDITKTYGNNLIQVDNSPVNYAVYNGDVNQDGIIDLGDVSLIENDAADFLTGYLTTDLTGDDFVDLADQTIADNNAADFVSKITP